MDWMRTYLNKFRGGGTTLPPVASFSEILWSAMGSFLGILAVYEAGLYKALPLTDHLFLVGSFGASAILIFGAPQSLYSQPRNLLLGHILSAFVGVSCSFLLDGQAALAAALAVSLALVLMHLSKSLHPPGGATALIAVIGSDEIHQLSYWFVLSPILSGALILLLVALLVNNLSPLRRYPDYWY
jgi:CBS-domain-containing membrane protein